MLPILPRTRRVAVAVTLAFALSGAAAACGSDDGGSDDTTTTVAEGDTDATGEDTEPTGDDADTPSPDAGDADRQDYVDALAASASDEDFATPDQANCIAEGYIDTIGVDSLRDAGITPQQLAEGDGSELDPLDIDEATANTLYDVLGTCDLDLRELYLDSFRQEGDLTPDQLACVEDTITADLVRDAFVADLLGDETALDPFEDVAVCFS